MMEHIRAGLGLKAGNPKTVQVMKKKIIGVKKSCLVLILNGKRLNPKLYFKYFSGTSLIK